jgi:hypothetical protein
MSTSVRTRVADSIFNHAAKAIEIKNIEARVTELERSGRGGAEWEVMMNTRLRARLENLKLSRTLPILSVTERESYAVLSSGLSASPSLPGMADDATERETFKGFHCEPQISIWRYTTLFTGVLQRQKPTSERDVVLWHSRLGSRPVRRARCALSRPIYSDSSLGQPHSCR